MVEVVEVTLRRHERLAVWHSETRDEIRRRQVHVRRRNEKVVDRAAVDDEALLVALGDCKQPIDNWRALGGEVHHVETPQARKQSNVLFARAHEARARHGGGRGGRRCAGADGTLYSGCRKEQRGWTGIGERDIGRQHGEKVRCASLTAPRQGHEVRHNGDSRRREEVAEVRNGTGRDGSATDEIIE